MNKNVSRGLLLWFGLMAGLAMLSAAVGLLILGVAVGDLDTWINGTTVPARNTVPSDPAPFALGEITVGRAEGRGTDIFTEADVVQD